MISCSSQRLPSGSANEAKLRYDCRSRVGARLVPLVPTPRPCQISLTSAPWPIRSSRAASTSSTIRYMSSIEPGVIVVSPAPNWIEAGEPGGVNCTTR